MLSYASQLQKSSWPVWFLWKLEPQIYFFIVLQCSPLRSGAEIKKWVIFSPLSAVKCGPNVESAKMVVIIIRTPPLPFLSHTQNHCLIKLLLLVHFYTSYLKVLHHNIASFPRLCMKSLSRKTIWGDILQSSLEIRLITFLHVHAVYRSWIIQEMTDQYVNWMPSDDDLVN